MENKKISNFFNFVYYPLLFLIIVSVYWSLKAIFVYTLEDLYALGSHSYVFLSYEYGDKTSALLVSVLIFSCLQSFYVKTLKQENIRFEEYRFRLGLLWTATIIAFLNSAYDVFVITSDFLRGRTEPLTLVETVITFTLALLTFFYMWADLRLKSFNKHFVFTSTGVLLSLCVLGIGIALYQAPPWLMKKQHEDLKRFQAVQTLQQEVKRFYERYFKLPQDLETLSRKMENSPAILKDPITQTPFSYKVMDRDAFEICATYHMDSKKAWRLSPFANRESYQQGLFCHKYVVGLPAPQGHCIEECLKSKMPE